MNEPQGQGTIEASGLDVEEAAIVIERMLKGRGKYRRRVVLEALLAWCTLELLAELDEEDKAAVLQGIVTPGETDE